MATRLTQSFLRSPTGNIVCCKASWEIWDRKNVWSFTVSTAFSSLTPAKYLLHCQSVPTESTVSPPQNTCCIVGQRQQNQQSHPRKIPVALSVSANRINSLTLAKYLLQCQSVPTKNVLQVYINSSRHVGIDVLHACNHCLYIIKTFHKHRIVLIHCTC